MEYVDSEKITSKTVGECIDRFDGVIIPGGFGNRGIEGKIQAIQYLREKKKPFFGICLGMQLAAIEFARNELKVEGATSEEFSKDSNSKIIHLMESQHGIYRKGGTMRLGAYPCRVLDGTKAAEAYRDSQISERHRHRYEFNNDYRSSFEEKGIVFSGLSPDDQLVEIMELKQHPWFVACQFHPELKSSPMNPHPLFREFVKASLASNKNPSRV